MHSVKVHGDHRIIESLTHNALLGFLSCCFPFSLQVLYMYAMTSGFVFLWDSCMCEHVCLSICGWVFFFFQLFFFVLSYYDLFIVILSYFIIIF